MKPRQRGFLQENWLARGATALREVHANELVDDHDRECWINQCS